MNSILKKTTAVIVAAVSAPLAMAQTAATGPDLTSLTSSISVGTVITAVLAVGATMVGLYLAIKGAKVVLGMVKGA